MKKWSILAVLAMSMVFAASYAQSQGMNEPPTALVSIYNVAPGKHLDFLKWMAARESISKEAGLAATVWYAHTDGGDWDYIAIGPVTTKEQDDKVDALSKKKGLTTGFKASLEFRQFIASHSDTFTIGPVSASDLVESAQK